MAKVKVLLNYQPLAITFTQTGFPPSLLLRRDFSEARRAKESLTLTLALTDFYGPSLP